MLVTRICKKISIVFLVWIIFCPVVPAFEFIARSLFFWAHFKAILLRLAVSAGNIAHAQQFFSFTKEFLFILFFCICYAVTHRMMETFWTGIQDIGRFLFDYRSIWSFTVCPFISFCSKNWPIPSLKYRFNAYCPPPSHSNARHHCPSCICIFQSLFIIQQNKGKMHLFLWHFF